MQAIKRIWAGLLARPRRVNLAGAVICSGLVGVAVAIEVFADMPPCPLCVFQRVAFLAMSATLLVGVVVPGRVAGLLTAAAGVGGLSLAGRHLWLQTLPEDQIPACGPGLDYLLGVFPLTDVIAMVLSGSGECAEVHRVLGVTIPAWTLLGFLVLGLFFLIFNWRARPSRHP
ncbi:disulfide bond formation protein B [Spiribacter sp. 2438]|uniref:disulfide bond formation protein B n=1 Tax=Spiribacter sp. 2438 TaxID=2666185 RepID=UPI0012AFA996|nr:disulfide bond formation protein B [Spiribacter sp. 2438]QGM22028.1 disulfide bond formation protein B [Spiribacter sp. 2438]